MNDVPAAFAWLLALPIAAVVAIAWRLVRRAPVPHRPRWRRHAVGWTISAALLGPLTMVPALAVIGTLLRWRELVGDPRMAIERAMAGAWIGGIWWLLASVLFFLLPYLPVLLLWARSGPALGALETTRRGLVASAALLAVPGTVVSVVTYGTREEPFGYHGVELLQFGTTIFVAITVSLLVPRLLIPSLRTGAFAGAVGGAGLEQPTG